ncbi:hypothetical protein PHLCEN_2v9208 [Hermanssonia centrifuga]|uniref:Uncharacterized protein n=1 Tax=Hermanssonia centrifuga TaxID=98765 RepID=A0A2R6NRJ9_9APHY|nr:hypothetical protein PHLCEN_2v9208 [Hermanssonia centrifuga]
MDIPDSPPPSHHANDSATAFLNPWAAKSLLASRQVFSQFPLALAKRIEGYPIKQVKVITPDFGQSVPEDDVLKATWLGHAVSILSERLSNTISTHLRNRVLQGFMVQLPRVSGLKPVRILFDPIWSERASPHQSAGPRRRLPPPCTIEELPDFQFVVTSHNQ